MFRRKTPVPCDCKGTCNWLADRLGRLESKFDALLKTLDDQSKRPVPRVRSAMEEMLPILDRFQEITLVAQGHPDLAQQFGLTSRQQFAARQEYEGTHWHEPDEPTPDGVVYG